MIKLPHFDNECQEADWWHENQEALSDEFEKAMDERRPKPGPGAAILRLAKVRGVSVEEMQARLRSPRESAAPAPSLKLPRSA